jgi:hypothetical protein
VASHIVLDAPLAQLHDLEALAPQLEPDHLVVVTVVMSSENQM